MINVSANSNNENGENEAADDDEPLDDMPSESETSDVEHENELTTNSSGKIAPPTAIPNLRNTSIKIRRSEEIQNTLKGYCSATETEYLIPILDVSTRWNSTDNMSEVALRLGSALDLLWQNCAKVSQMKISPDEWSLPLQIHKFLSDFKRISTVLGGQHYITLPQFIVAFNLLVNKIRMTISKSDNEPDRDEVDEILLLASQTGRDKMLEHYRITNWLYCSALILDPRHKVETFSPSE
uniref:Uncharacterized protein n=1 Tax=Bracon brevicornis TaxID=1563983 RepID=A0A6V7JKY1_9HYME